jgi:hypothetical protein
MKFGAHISDLVEIFIVLWALYVADQRNVEDILELFQDLSRPYFAARIHGKRKTLREKEYFEPFATDRSRHSLSVIRLCGTFLGCQNCWDDKKSRPF